MTTFIPFRFILASLALGMVFFTTQTVVADLPASNGDVRSTGVVAVPKPSSVKCITIIVLGCTRGIVATDLAQLSKTERVHSLH